MNMSHVLTLNCLPLLEKTDIRGPEQQENASMLWTKVIEYTRLFQPHLGHHVRQTMTVLIHLTLNVTPMLASVKVRISSCYTVLKYIVLGFSNLWLQYVVLNDVIFYVSSHSKTCGVSICVYIESHINGIINHFRSQCDFYIQECNMYIKLL